MINNLVHGVDDATALSNIIAQRDKALQTTMFSPFTTTTATDATITIINNNSNSTQNSNKDDVQRDKLTVSNQFDTSYYTYLLNKLSSSSGATSDMLQFVALHEIDWGMYVQLVAKTVAEEIAHELLCIVQAANFENNEKKQLTPNDDNTSNYSSTGNKINLEDNKWSQIT